MRGKKSVLRSFTDAAVDADDDVEDMVARILVEKDFKKGESIPKFGVSKQ